MKRTILVLAAALALSGCAWYDQNYGAKNKVIYPDEEAASAQPAQAAQPPEVASISPQTEPAQAQPVEVAATEPASAPVDANAPPERLAVSKVEPAAVKSIPMPPPPSWPTRPPHIYKSAETPTTLPSLPDLPQRYVWMKPTQRPFLMDTPLTWPVRTPAAPAASTRTRPAERTVPRVPAAPRPVSPTTAPAPAPVPPAPVPTTRAIPTTYRVIGKPEVVTAAVIQVNDKFITLDQILFPLRQKLQSAAKGGDVSEFRKEAARLIQEEVRRQVEETLLLAEAELRMEDQQKKEIAEQVRAQVRQAVAEVGGSRLLLDERLHEEGTDLPTWEESLRRDLTVQAYAARRFGERVVINRQTMWDYYNTHRDDFRTPEKLQMQVISAPFRGFLPTSRPVMETDYFAAGRLAREHIDKAAAELAKGYDFAQVAKIYSRDAMAGAGGVWPALEKGSFRSSQVEDAALAQKIGQVSKVIETADGYYIVKTLAVIPASERTFEQAQDQIEEELRHQQFRKLTAEYVQKMQSKTTIQPVDRFDDIALEAAERRYFKKGM